MSKILGYEKYTFIVSAILSVLIGGWLGSLVALGTIAEMGSGVAGFLFLCCFIIVGAASFFTLVGFSVMGIGAYNNLIFKKLIDIDDYFPDEEYMVASLVIGVIVTFICSCLIIGSFFSCIV